MEWQSGFHAQMKTQKAFWLFCAQKLSNWADMMFAFASFGWLVDPLPSISTKSHVKKKRGTRDEKI